MVLYRYNTPSVTWRIGAWYEDHKDEKSDQGIESMNNSLKEIIKEKYPGRKFIELDSTNDTKSRSEIVLFTGSDDFKRIRKFLKKRINV